MSEFHIRERPQAFCDFCGKPATHEVRNHQNASYGYFCKRHAHTKKRLLEAKIQPAQLRQHRAQEDR